MRKLATALIGTVLGLAALLSFKSHTGTAGPISALPADTANPAASGPANTHAPPTGQHATYTGAPANTRYGPVQVQIAIASGKLADITVLQVPDNGGYEQQIVADAVPTLKSEALSAQSAHIDIVSGATYTSEGYAQSLQSALDKAGLK